MVYNRQVKGASISDRGILNQRRLRSDLSRSELAARRLGLSLKTEEAHEPGLLLVQIDGLSHEDLRKALNDGQMPFLRKLLEREGYSLHPTHSGIPSSTPAVQGELFYGVRAAVPAYGYLDRKKGTVVSMLDSATVNDVEERLKQSGDTALLDGGSAYGAIYEGGAAEARICAANKGFGQMFTNTGPITLLLLFLAHTMSWLRVAALLFLEFIMAFYDFFRGLYQGNELYYELVFIPVRVTISVLFRELAVIGGSMDLTRGLPIVFVNFLGYDEQSHHRGPGSSFAHWTLKGIDKSIEKLWKAARRSKRRGYEVWIFSDHGQEEVIPFEHWKGISAREVVTTTLGGIFERDGHILQGLAFERPGEGTRRRDGHRPRGIAHKRAEYLGGYRWLSFLKRLPYWDQPCVDDEVVLTTYGPMGHVYLREPFDGRKQRDEAAKALVKEGGIPLVLAGEGQDEARAWTEDGVYILPEQAEQVLGSNSPHTKQIASDLARVCHHQNAGDLVISGHRKGAKNLSFDFELGSHGGPGPSECNSFALLPEEIELEGEEGALPRPQDLYHAALSYRQNSIATPERAVCSSSHSASYLKLSSH